MFFAPKCIFSGAFLDSIYSKLRKVFFQQNTSKKTKSVKSHNIFQLPEQRNAPKCYFGPTLAVVKSMHLTESQAVEIYMLKMSIAVDSQRLRGASPPIAVRFGVSSRTIRDIWNRKTWAFATKHLWHLESNCPDASMQVIVHALYILLGAGTDFMLRIEFVPDSLVGREVQGTRSQESSIADRVKRPQKVKMHRRSLKMVAIPTPKRKALMPKNMKILCATSEIRFTRTGRTGDGASPLKRKKGGSKNIICCFGILLMTL